MTTITMAPERHQKIQELRELRDELIKAGVATNDIDTRIRELAVPRVHEVLYRGPHLPVVIVNVSDWHVLYVPEGTSILSTHPGNLYDANGNSPYAFIP